MFRSERQQCQAIRLLLSGLNLEYLWTETGPTDQACKWVKRNPLSSGESILLRAAFDLWNGEGKVTLWQIQGTLDQRHCERLFSLALAAGYGAECIDVWITSGGSMDAVREAAAKSPVSRLEQLFERGLQGVNYGEPL